MNCNIEDCGGKLFARGWCAKHYMRWRKHGDPLQTETGKSLQHLKDHCNSGCCYLWPYSKSRGRPRLFFEGRARFGSQVVLELNGIPRPFPGAVVRHLCGKGHLGCFNLACICWGTMAENCADRATHGMQAQGETNGRSKLTEDQVIWVKDMRGILTQKEIAGQLGLDLSQISRIHQGRTWKHLSHD